MVLQTKIARKKKNFPLEHYRRIYSADDSGIYSKYFLAICESQRTLSVGNCVGEYASFCEMPTDYICL
jgi:hypothetical protein